MNFHLVDVFGNTRYSGNQLAVFFDCGGIATGCLAAYLVKNGMFGKGQIELTIGQGYGMNRPSELKIRAGMNKDEFEIFVGGKVIEVAAGSWRSESEK